MSVKSCKTKVKHYQDQGQWTEVLLISEKISESAPDDWQNHVSMGDALLNLERWAAAAAAYKKALSIKQDFDWGWHNLAVAFGALGRWEDANECYQTLANIKPSFWDENRHIPLVTKHHLAFLNWKRHSTAEVKGSTSAPLKEQNSTGYPQVNISESDIRLIAYYLPQFHPIPENDEWWGKGFTEWTNVSKAQPLFDGHYQPHLPADLGFYDLRLPETREAQAKLAKKYGVYGFCYYYYWFSGKRLLERPLDEMLASGKPDFPFCLCWANENWSRRWDGAENDILMAQDHSADNDKSFAESLLPYLRDKRYICVEDKPLLVIYRANLIPGISEAISRWRSVFRENGIGEVYLCGALTFGQTVEQTAEMGFDASVEFPPHGVSARLLDPNQLGANNYQGNIYEFGDVVSHSLAASMPENETKFLTAMAGWDNTARKGKAGNVFLNSSPETYEWWLRGLIEKTKRRYRSDERIVFINAWNEWAEGTHLEPDTRYKHQYLEATSKALSGNNSLNSLVNLLRHLPIESAEHLNELLDETQRKIASFNRAMDSTVQLSERLTHKCVTIQKIVNSANDSVLSYIEAPTAQQTYAVGSQMIVSGWVLGENVQASTVEMLSQGKVISTTAVNFSRPDVFKAYPSFDHKTSGYYVVYDIRTISPHPFDLKAVFADGSTYEIGSIHFDVVEESIAVPMKIRKAVKWDIAHRQEISTIFEQMRSFPIKENFYEALEELDFIVQHGDRTITRLSNFILSGQIGDLF
ncbi:MAG: glycoside hydrolase family 99-like domain-containing protein [Phormidesmis sp.]